MQYNITPATKADAPFIARTVMGAVGEELCCSLAGGKDNLGAVTALFTRLAGEENSQYSYRNTFVARDTAGHPIGAIVVYDGARLHELRKAFAAAANELLGWNLTDEEMYEWGDETEPGEVYIDSLYVSPEYRGKGLASQLILHATENCTVSDKPFGLLVEPDNVKAKSLYEKLGFKQAGISNFFAVPMLHLQKH